MKKTKSQHCLKVLSGVCCKFLLSFVQTSNWKLIQTSKVENCLSSYKFYGWCVCWFSALYYSDCIAPFSRSVYLRSFRLFLEKTPGFQSIESAQNYWVYDLCRSNNRYSLVVFRLVGLRFVMCILHQLHTLWDNLNLAWICSQNACVCVRRSWLVVKLK